MFFSLCHVHLFAMPWTEAHPASLSFTISQSLLNLMFIESVMLSNYLILWFPLVLLPSIFPSIRDFSNESDLCNRRLKYCNSSFSHFNEYSVQISFRIYWLDPLAVKQILKSLLQLHNYQFFGIQPSLRSNSYICTTTGKTIALTRWTFSIKWCLFKVLPGFVIAFLPGSKHLLFAWLLSPSPVILESKRVN